jgi:hypothetical protein
MSQMWVFRSAISVLQYSRSAANWAYIATFRYSLDMTVRFNIFCVRDFLARGTGKSTLTEINCDCSYDSINTHKQQFFQVLRNFKYQLIHFQ